MMPALANHRTLSDHGPAAVFSTDERIARQAAEHPARILIVEDDYLAAMDVESGLIEAGFAVVGIASSADEAVKLAKSERPALAIMDIRLKGRRDGIAAALEMFKDIGIRCIFATAHHDPQMRQQAQPAAPLGWLAKPYTIRSLVTMVRQALAELGKPKKQ